MLFQEADFYNQKYFPKVLIVRKMKRQKDENVDTPDGMVKFIRQSLKDNMQQQKDYMNEKIDDSKQQLSNQISLLDNDILGVNKDIHRV